MPTRAESSEILGSTTSTLLSGFHGCFELQYRLAEHDVTNCHSGNKGDLTQMFVLKQWSLDHGVSSKRDSHVDIARSISLFRRKAPSDRGDDCNQIDRHHYRSQDIQKIQLTFY
jgi:hypothetical protein